MCLKKQDRLKSVFWLLFCYQSKLSWCPWTTPRPPPTLAVVAGSFRDTKTTYSGNKTTTKTLILTDLVFLDTFVEILVLKVSDIGERIPERGCHIHVISVHAYVHAWLKHEFLVLELFGTSMVSSIDSFSKTSKWISIIFGAKWSWESACFVSVVSSTLLLSRNNKNFQRSKK